MAQQSAKDRLAELKLLSTLKLFKMDTIVMLYLAALGFLHIISLILSKFTSVAVATAGPAIMIMIYMVAITSALGFANKIQHQTYLKGKFWNFSLMALTMVGLLATAYFLPQMLPGVMKAPTQAMFSAIGLP